MPDLARALEAAVAAARAAGDLLRADLHRPGGPRGYGDKAEADVEAERLIRERLLAAFPGFGYLGEETGAVVGPPGSPVWLVDPNDGTRDFLVGRRGSSVSIGLVRAGRPVLGVVHPFAYPDDEGDLFSWAEGLGPPRRRGLPRVARFGALRHGADHARRARRPARCLEPGQRIADAREPARRPGPRAPARAGGRAGAARQRPDPPEPGVRRRGGGVRRRRRAVHEPPPDGECSGPKQGWVLVALQLAFHALLRFEGPADGVVWCVRRGGDTDTNAAIAGALLGAVHGREAVPPQWRRMVLSCRALGPAARRPRPHRYWPTDVLELAERLLLAGQAAAG